MWACAAGRSPKRLHRRTWADAEEFDVTSRLQVPTQKLRDKITRLQHDSESLAGRTTAHGKGCCSPAMAFCAKVPKRHSADPAGIANSLAQCGQESTTMSMMCREGECSFVEAQRRHLASDHHSAVDVPITPRSASPSALTSVFSGVGPGWIASQDWHRDGAGDGARRVWRGCGIYCEGRGRVFSGVSPG